jgi:hypothetical protein
MCVILELSYIFLVSFNKCQNFPHDYRWICLVSVTTTWGVCGKDITSLLSPSPSARRLGKFQAFLTRSKAEINTHMPSCAHEQGFSRGNGKK